MPMRLNFHLITVSCWNSREFKTKIELTYKMRSQAKLKKCKLQILSTNKHLMNTVLLTPFLLPTLMYSFRDKQQFYFGDNLDKAANSLKDPKGPVFKI